MSWFSSFLDGRNLEKKQKLWNISTEIYILYAGAARMLLHINGSYTMGKIEIISSKVLSIFRLRSIYEPDLTI
jgi:hypothetical protein